ncbi:hypothetical protein VTN77DRAFT_2754 [Rasamsonia byssochlamydoides]|uniref:uncharacterized protein n=1 Tax=Rasamsonia byssochlamydoides TaxID=89139 RepID=UPI0037444702
MGTNAQIFEAQLSMIRNQLVAQHEFVFLQGEVETDPAPGIPPSSPLPSLVPESTPSTPVPTTPTTYSPPNPKCKPPSSSSTSSSKTKGRSTA